MGKRYAVEIERWADIVTPEKRVKDTRTGDEIAADVIKHAGLAVV